MGEKRKQSDGRRRNQKRQKQFHDVTYRIFGRAREIQSTHQVKALLSNYRIQCSSR